MVRIFFIPTIRSASNVHYILPGGNYLNANAGVVPMQNIVFAAKFHQRLSDGTVNDTHSQIRILRFKCGRVQGFSRRLVGKSHN